MNANVGIPTLADTIEQDHLHIALTRVHMNTSHKLLIDRVFRQFAMLR